MFSVLTRNRDFAKLFAVQLVLFGGDWFVLIPLLTLLPDLTGRGLWGGLILAADMLVLALSLPYAGTLADRVNRRTIMLSTSAVSLGCVLLLLLVRSAGTVWIALVAVSILAAAKAFFTPAAGAALPNVVDAVDLPAANALAGSAWGTMLVLGASLGGIVGARFGPYPCFVVTAGCMALALVLTAGIRRPLQADRDEAAPARPLRAVGEALRYIGHRPRVAALVTVKSAVGLGNGVLVVFPMLAAGMGPIGTGLLFAARGFGALIGPLLFRRVLAHRDWLLPGLAISMGLYGAAYLAVSVSPWFGLSLVLVVIAHVAGGGNWTMSNFALQEEVPDALLGRVLATDMMIATLAIAASQLVVGLFVDSVPVPVMFASCGAVTLVYSIIWRLWTWRQTRRPSPAEVVSS